ncbi:MAG: hypothetical protein QF570_20340 [Myxococcota bacterium]|nr:hypothetical protein [Myxococcota bacterium]
MTLLTCLVTAGTALANPAVTLEWTSKNGVAIDPPSTSVTVNQAEVQAAVPLVLRISLVLDEVAIHEFGFTVRFDDDDLDELDFDTGNEPAGAATYGPFNSVDVFNAVDSIEGVGGYGDFGPYRGCVPGSLCDTEDFSGGTPVGNQTIVIEEVTFIPTANASNDRRDVFIYDVTFKEEFRDASGVVIPFEDIDFGSASVVPEPRIALMQAGAVLALAALARRRTRSALQ